MGNIYLIPQDVLTQYIFLTNTGRNEEAYALLKKNKHRLGMITNVGDTMEPENKKSETETEEETMQNMVDSENDSDDTTEGDEDESGVEGEPDEPTK